MTDPPADVLCPGGIGLVWGIAREGLTASLIGWGSGQGLEEHCDDERDVLMIAAAVARSSRPARLTIGASRPRSKVPHRGR